MARVEYDIVSVANVRSEAAGYRLIRGVCTMQWLRGKYGAYRKLGVTEAIYFLVRTGTFSLKGYKK